MRRKSLVSLIEEYDVADAAHHGEMDPTDPQLKAGINSEAEAERNLIARMKELKVTRVLHNQRLYEAYFHPTPPQEERIRAEHVVTAEELDGGEMQGGRS